MSDTYIDEKVETNSNSKHSDCVKNNRKSILGPIYACWFLGTCYLFGVVINPITVMECNKQDNKCVITQNFVSKYNVDLFDESRKNVLILSEKSISSMSSNHYELVIKEYKANTSIGNILSPKERLLFDVNWKASKQFNKDIKNFTDNTAQNTYKKLYIPLFDIGILILLLLSFLVKLERYRVAYFITVILYPAIYYAIMQLMSMFN